MVKGISNIVDSALPAISIASFTASIFMGRKFALAASYKMSGVIASLMRQPDTANEWNKTSHDYWTLAKKDTFRDLTAAAGFITLGLASNYAGKALLAKEEPKERGWIDNNSILLLSNISILAVLVGVPVLGTWDTFNKLVPHTGVRPITKNAIEKGVLTQEQKIDLIMRMG